MYMQTLAWSRLAQQALVLTAWALWFEAWPSRSEAISSPVNELLLC